MKLNVLIPAHNEAGSIAATIEAILDQGRQADEIIVIPNGCTDDTADIARRYPVTVMELPKLNNRKSEALNLAWNEHCQNADLVVCLDADTVLPSNALADWEQEFNDPALGGSSSKFTMLRDSILGRVQKAEFAAWTTRSLKRGWTSVLAGTGCIIRNSVLTEIVAETERDGPWHYGSQTEDFELTYQIRSRGYRCQVSPKVRAYTDAMDDLPSLWNQRMKWQVGTVEDLFRIGFNRYTRLDWGQQMMGLAMASLRFVWLGFMVALVAFDLFAFQPLWLLPMLLFIAVDIRSAMIVPERSRKDIVLAASFFPLETFAWLRSAWFLAGWAAAIKSLILGTSKDRWAAQYAAETRG